MTNEHSSETEERPVSVLVAFRPLLYWIPIALILLLYDYHRKNARKTFIQAQVILNGAPITSGTTVSMKVDGKDWNFARQAPIPIGNHKIDLSVPDSTTFTTNIFIWYGTNQLGSAPVYIQRGNIDLQISPMADIAELQGKYENFKMRRTSLISTNLPVGPYSMVLTYGDRQENYSFKIEANRTLEKSFNNQYGIVQIKAIPAQAQFSIQNMKDTPHFRINGKLPRRITLPVGTYNLTSWIEDYRQETLLPVVQGTTNQVDVVFEYGTLKLHTTPSGANVFLGRKSIGMTPLETSLKPGPYDIRLELNGYAPVNFNATVAPNQILGLSTNLVNRAFSTSVEQAERAVSQDNYEQAITHLRAALLIDPDADDLRSRLKRYEGIQAKRDHDQQLADRKSEATKLFQSITSKTQHADLFMTHQWQFERNFEQVNKAVTKAIEDGPVNYSLESEQPMGNDKKLFIGIVKGFRSLGQRCMVLVTEIQPNHVVVQAKFWQFVTGKKITLGLGGIDPSSLIPLHPKYFQADQRNEVNQRRQQTATDFQRTLVNLLK